MGRTQRDPLLQSPMTITCAADKYFKRIWYGMQFDINFVVFRYNEGWKKMWTEWKNKFLRRTVFVLHCRVNDMKYHLFIYKSDR